VRKKRRRVLWKHLRGERKGKEKDDWLVKITWEEMVG
jgi:hypothetical protein